VHAGNDYNDLAVDAIEDPIREPTDNRPSGISVNYRVDGRISSNAVAHCLPGRQDLIAQAGTLALIPQKCLPNIRSRRWTDNYWH
jgi:hypothetical protein